MPDPEADEPSEAQRRVPAAPADASQRPEVASIRARSAGLIRPFLEGAALLVSPIAAVFGLRITLMSPPDLNDPAMHTTFVIDPSDIYVRYTALFTPTERLREGARVGFLIPARLSYLLFGAVPGFLVFRYVLALVALVPAYLLVRRLYGRIAGAVAVIVILTCPVIILAWGTDFPELGDRVVSHRRPCMPGDAVGAASLRVGHRLGGAASRWRSGHWQRQRR